MNNETYYCFRAPCLALLTLLATPLVVLGQTDLSQTDSLDDLDDNVYELTPFEVDASKDVGYTAVDSLAGGRQSVPVRVTPSAISSMTEKFLDDLSVTNLQDALQWGLNAVPTSFVNGLNGGSGGNVFNYWSISVRGDSKVQGGNPPTKNYFPTFMPIDTYNIERIEINGGPNSILFGIGDIGGSTTSYTKMAQLGSEITEFTTRFSSFGGYRFSTDINRSLGENWAIRLNAVAADERGWRDGDFNKKLGADFATTYKLSNSTQFRFQVEGWKQEKAIYSSLITDGMSLWDGSTNATTWGEEVAGVNDNPLDNAGAPGVKTMEAWGGPENYLVWTPSVGLQNWAGGLRTFGIEDAGRGSPAMQENAFVYAPTGTTVPALPDREFTIAPSDATLKPEALSSTLSMETVINDNSEFQIAGYYYVDKSHAINYEGAGGGVGFGVARDLNRQLPDGPPNPNYGKRYSDYFLDEQQQNHNIWEVRGQYNYHFDTRVFEIPLNQSISVSAGHQVTELGTRQHQAGYLDGFPGNWGESNWTQSMIWGRVYWDDPDASLSLPNSYNGVPIDYIGLPYNWFDWDSKQEIDYVGAFSQTRLWNDRLNISLGVRRDEYDNQKLDARGTNDSFASDGGTTYSAGVVGYVTPWLGLVANASENFQPAAGGIAPSIYGEQFGPSFGKGRSAGIRISTLDHKYWMSLNFYKDKATDVIGGDSPGFQGIWNNYFDAGGGNTDIGPAGNVRGTPGDFGANLQYVDTYDVEYSGVELEVTMNPTQNIRVQVHYSEPDGERTNNGPNGIRYFNENLPIWQEFANLGTPESDTLASSLENGQSLIDAIQEPTIVSGISTRIYNVFAAYSFLDGSLEGFEIGGGITGLGDQYGGVNAKNADGNRITSPSYYTASLLLGYSTSFNTMNREVGARFQLNISNLLDEDKLIYTGYSIYDGASYPTAFRYLNPLEATLTATFSF